MNNRPLKDLFDQLRANGFPLGIAEYEDFLSALGGNFLDLKKDTYESLKRLTRLLWYTPSHSKELFDELFDLSWNKEITKRAIAAGKEKPAIDTRPTETPEDKTDKISEEDTVTPKPTPDTRDSETSPVVPLEPTVSNPEISYWLSLKSSHVRAVPTDPEEEETLARNAIRLGGGYFPIRPRSLELIWRFLKAGGEEVRSNELDINGTVERFARKGGLIVPVYTSEMHYSTRLIVLIDHSPSMAAFHDFSKRMAESAPVHDFSHIPHFSSTLYFSNVPEDTLYKSPGHMEGIDIRNLRGSFERKPLRIIIISDAGAARGTRSRSRIIATQRALRSIAPFTLSMVWVNPMPQHRWKGTSADEISNIVPMVEARDNGLIHAVNILRGKVPQKAIGS